MRRLPLYAINKYRRFICDSNSAPASTELLKCGLSEKFVQVAQKLLFLTITYFKVL